MKNGNKSAKNFMTVLFGKKASKKKEKKPPNIPERIKKDQPKPELKPSGSLKAQATKVDRAVQEKRDAEIAENKREKPRAYARSKPVRLKCHFNKGKDQGTDRGR